MDRETLLRLADRGISAFPPSELHALADWCWDFGESTGDARYSSLSRSFDAIGESFDLHGAVESATVHELDIHLKRSVPQILDADTAELGAHLARSLRESIVSII
jgi:hypothetical protein